MDNRVDQNTLSHCVRDQNRFGRSGKMETFENLSTRPNRFWSRALTKTGLVQVETFQDFPLCEQKWNVDQNRFAQRRWANPNLFIRG